MMLMMMNIDIEMNIYDDIEDVDDDNLESSLRKRKKDILPPHLRYWQWSVSFPAKY